MAQQNFRNYMAPDFQASTQPAMEWMPWDDQQQQQGADLGSILGQLKGKMGTKQGGADGSLPYEGNGMPTDPMTGMAAGSKAAGSKGKSSL